MEIYPVTIHPNHDIKFWEERGIKSCVIMQCNYKALRETCFYFFFTDIDFKKMSGGNTVALFRIKTKKGVGNNAL